MIYSYNGIGNGNRKVEYAYDAFGNCSIVYGTSHDLARRNPIRYRGYYFDRETGLYYLNARYYNPQWRRFISPDSPDYLDPETPNGLNLYAYCYNDPVNYADPSGQKAEWYDVLACIGMALFVASAIVLTAGLAGVVIGGAAGVILYGAAIGTVALGIVGAGVGFAGGMIYDYSHGNSFGTSTWAWTKAGFGIGTVGGALIGSAVGGAAAYSVTGLTNVSFWTGLGTNGAQIAADVAAQQGLITLGQTFGGRAVQFLTNIVGGAATRYLWISLSQTMASTINMTSIILFCGEIINDSIWYLYELPILIKRGIQIIEKFIGQ